jgi:hypothetical protein
MGSPGDICCVPTGGSAGTCAPGNCCADSQCTDPQKPNCVNRVCTGCPAVTNGQYYVDPDVADDSAATGGPTCPFKTISKALGFLGSAQAAPVTVNVKANVTIGAGETFPLLVPVNVSCGASRTRPRTSRTICSGGGVDSSGMRS